MADGALVVAGIDGSPDSWGASDFAASEAERRGVWLRLVHGDDQRSVGNPPLLPSDIVEQNAPPASSAAVEAESATAVLDHVAAEIRRRHDGLRVDCAVIVGNPSGVLIDESKTARLLVLGSQGLSRLGSLLIGSVSEQVATHAEGPVVVVPAHGESGPMRGVREAECTSSAADAGAVGHSVRLRCARPSRMRARPASKANS